MNIFKPRIEFKGFEYPECTRFKEAIQHAYWLVSEWNFTSDVQDFHTKLTPVHREAIRRLLLAISQIEISVKRSWAKIGERFPKPEIEQTGMVFAESEVRHSDAYSHLLEVLGLNDDFTMLMQVECIQRRVDYLTKYLKGAAGSTNQNYTLHLALFALFIENVSLFAQFAAIKAFNKHTNTLKDIDNVVQATQKEEEIHARFGAYLINIVKEENPEWFDDEFYAKIVRAAHKAYEAEAGIIDWIFEEGELDFLPKDDLKEYIKHRFNTSVEMIGGPKVFETDLAKVESLRWFDEEILTDTAIDFFNKKSTAYSKNVRSITRKDIFRRPRAS